MAAPPQSTRQLTWWFAWAVVFCDIGTSIYYVPGILYAGVGNLAALFVLLTTGGFILLSLKYAEIAWRNPEGGGVVSVATKAFGPRWGALGGMLITVDYFLTSSISSVSGFHYASTLVPALRAHVPMLACCSLGFLAIVNIIGIRESAALSFAMAIMAITVDLVVVGMTIPNMDAGDWTRLWSSLSAIHDLSLGHILIGFAGAWLAFSGLESISQLAPAMREPLSRTARAAMLAVIVTIVVTSPVLTALCIAVLPESVKAQDPERLISALGIVAGGRSLEVAVGLSAAALLIFAANTAIIGGYHVFLALGTRGFMPSVVLRRNSRFNTPHIAILITTLVPVVVINVTQGHLTLLGEMYAFGLLGAFTLESAGLDVIRWRLRQRGAVFWLGIFTTGLVVTAWCINLQQKQIATFFGGGLTLLGMIVAIANQQGWITEAVYRIPFVARRGRRTIAAAERLADDVGNLVTLAQALEVTALYPSSTLVAIRGRNPHLMREACARAKGFGERAFYCIFVEERPGLFVGNTPPRPNDEAIGSLRHAIEDTSGAGIEVIPIWTVSHNAAQAIAHAANALRVSTVMMGVSRRPALYHLLRGHVVNGLARRLPKRCHLILCN